MKRGDDIFVRMNCKRSGYIYIYIYISIIAKKEWLITGIFNLLRNIEKCKRNIVSNGICKISSEKRKVSVVNRCIANHKVL